MRLKDLELGIDAYFYVNENNILADSKTITEFIYPNPGKILTQNYQNFATLVGWQTEESAPNMPNNIDFYYDPVHNPFPWVALLSRNRFVAKHFLSNSNQLVICTKCNLTNPWADHKLYNKYICFNCRA